jgi:hypothetical protein
LPPSDPSRLIFINTMPKIMSLKLILLEGFYHCTHIARSSSLIKNIPKILPQLFIFRLEIFLQDFHKLVFGNLRLRVKAKHIPEFFGVKVLSKQALSNKSESILIYHLHHFIVGRVR